MLSLLGTRVLTARPLSGVLGATRLLPGALRSDRRRTARQIQEVVDGTKMMDVVKGIVAPSLHTQSMHTQSGCKTSRSAPCQVGRLNSTTASLVVMVNKFGGDG